MVGGVPGATNPAERYFMHRQERRVRFTPARFKKKRYVSCAECSELPCEIWAAVRDPQLSDQQFEASIKERITNLGGNNGGI